MVVRQVYGLKLHGLPFGDEELRLLDAVVGGERLEQFATPLEDGLECGERNVLLRCRVFKIIYEILRLLWLLSKCYRLYKL